MNNRLEHIWFYNMIRFQQWLRSFSMEGDVARKDNQIYLPSASVPFDFVLHFEG